MNNDLISREALKERFEELHLHPDLIDLIDNATTVEPDKELKEKVETYKNAYRIMSDAFESEVTKNPRPKGEWLKMSDRYGVYFACNKCGYDREKSITNFCPNCGAKMKGGSNG